MSISDLHRLINRYNLTDENETKNVVKKINSFLKKNPEMNEIDTKDLNCEINIPGYVFCKQNGVQKMIKKYYTPNCRSKQNPYDIMEIINQLENRINSKLNDIVESLNTLKNDGEDRDIIINKIIDKITEIVPKENYSTGQRNQWDNYIKKSNESFNTSVPTTPQYSNPIFKFVPK